MPHISAIEEKTWKHFPTLVGEKVIFVIKQHWITLVQTFVFIFCFSSFFLFLFSVVFTRVLNSVEILFISIATVLILSAVFVVHTVSNPYYHIYILTTKNIVELSFSPLFASLDNEVLLEQVKCTEIDVQVGGVINQFLDIGDVVLTFDRPTHKEDFTFSKIQNPRALSVLLNNSLHQLASKSSEQYVWYHPTNQPDKYTFTEEIFRSSL